MPLPFPQPEFPQGMSLTSQQFQQNLQNLARIASQQSLQPGQFQGGAYNVQRKIGGGGGSTTVTTGIEPAFAMAVDTIPAFSAISTSVDDDGLNVYCDPGFLEASDEPTPMGVIMLEWEETGVTDETTVGRRLVPIVVGDDTDQRALRRTCINCSGTDIRASESQQVVLIGFNETVSIDDGEGLVEETRFVATNIMDFAALPGFSTTTGDIQIPYHDAAARDFKLDQENCDEV